ncbi:MAG: response regulator transcription factor, partial [Candidatus Gracilibacteria bacterium]|nr:response regulator transcription factor [Candidatus Gracilibacteria bacterium]
MQKILIIEDNIGISTSLKLYLENSDFEIILHDEGLQAIDMIKRQSPDIIILDINLPGKNGIDICKELRLFSEIPVIMLTARSGELDRIEGLETGADDYIAKPFSPRELLARIKTILRRSNNSSQGDINKMDNRLIFEDISIDPDKKITQKKGENINLTGNEFDILVKIVQENGKIVKRET